MKNNYRADILIALKNWPVWAIFCRLRNSLAPDCLPRILSTQLVINIIVNREENIKFKVLVIVVKVMSNRTSVIITAHNRKKYIQEALSSVINNNLPKDKLEIIIVKNYKDDVIDSEIERLSKQYNIISLIENDFRLGAKISKGIKSS
ncbi:MAG: glycosyltransferase [Candidatus Nanopusillus sp.]